MIKILSKSLALYFLFTTLLLSANIDKVNIIGNKRISKDSIIIFSKINMGSEYNQDLINDSLKNLYETNFFEDVKISFDKDTLTIELIEKPIIEELNITGVKKKKFFRIY